MMHDLQILNNVILFKILYCNQWLLKFIELYKKDNVCDGDAFDDVRWLKLWDFTPDLQTYC